ncbi:hypothetical protein [Spongorhabdus nitratireducens]
MNRLLIVLCFAFISSGCTTALTRIVEASVYSTAKDMPVHESFYISPATETGDSIYRWHYSEVAGKDMGSWIHVRDINDETYHIVNKTEGMLFEYHFWVQNHKILKAELHYLSRVAPLKVEPVKPDGMFTSFEVTDLKIPQKMEVRGKSYSINRIETLTVDTTVEALGKAEHKQYVTVRYISNQVPLGVVMEETFFSTQLLRDNWEFVRQGLEALDPLRPKHDVLLKLAGSFREKEKQNFQLVFYQEPRPLPEP